MAILSRIQTIKFLRIVWTVVILWFEYGIFWHSVRKCDWPDSRFHLTSTTTRPTHVLVVADPQIIDHRSYPGRLPSLTFITQVLVDLNIRKGWREATRLNPDAVVFLGDMMDGGRFPMPDAEYEGYYKRFKHIFALDHNVAEYFIPGNHDIGLRLSSAESEIAHERYVSHFGSLNHHVSLAGHNLIFLDAPGLAEEDLLREQTSSSYGDWQPIQGGAIQFVTSIADSLRPPVILFSHIPLYRPDNTDCGPLRERGTIQQGFGESYQNVLGQQATNFLFGKLKPSLILSGDDHDYCEYNHTFGAPTNPLHAREVTVKSPSMVMNVKRPGFQLLSLLPERYWNDSTTVTHADEPCLLPDQLSIYLSTYLPFLLLSLLIVFLVNVKTYRNYLPTRAPNVESVSLQQRSAVLKQRLTSHEDSDEEQVADDYYVNHASSPLPTPASARKHKDSPRQTRTFTFLGRRRRIYFPQLSRPLVGFIFKVLKALPAIFSSSIGVRDLKHRGILRNFIHDAATIAIFPILTILLVSLWVMNF